MPRRQCHQFFAPAEIERITCDQKRAGPRLGNGCKGGVKFVLAAGVHDVKLQPERTSGLLHFGRLALGIGIGVIQEYGNPTSGLRNDFAQQSETLRVKLACEKGYSRDVAGRPVEAFNQAVLHRIVTKTKHDWNGRGRGLRRERRRAAGCDENGHLPAHQVGCERRQSIISTVR